MIEVINWVDFKNLYKGNELFQKACKPLRDYVTKDEFNNYYSTYRVWWKISYYEDREDETYKKLYNDMLFMFGLLRD